MKNKNHFERPWFPLSENKSTDLTITSYNILAECNLLAYLFKEKNLKDLTIMKRKDRIFKELESCKADIICLQEVDVFFVSCLEKWGKKRNYDLVFHKKGSDSKEEGCVTLFRKDKFRFKKKYFNHLGMENSVNYFLAKTENEFGI